MYELLIPKWKDHICRIIKSRFHYCDLNTHWFLITLLYFNINHCENEAGPSCACENISRIRTCSRPSIRSEPALNVAEQEINDWWVRAQTITEERERELCLSVYIYWYYVTKGFQKRFCQSINQSITAASAKIQPWRS